MQKSLSLSQQQHLLALIERASASQLAVNTFIEYLRGEHSAPAASGWQITDVQMGFVQSQPVGQRSTAEAG